MDRLEILKVGDPVLREKAKPVKKITKETKNLLDRMQVTMREANGVGLAAPQVGVSRRIIVVDAGDGLIELINPAIKQSTGCVADIEGCLSVPGVYGEVERASIVTVEGLDRNGKEIRIEAQGLKARALQHEIDHLDGILFIDKARIIENTELDREVK